MRRVLICCQVFENEINDLFSKIGISYPVVCISSEYHNDPKKLRVKLQEEIDNQHDADEILLGYGCCGNAVIGLRATTADLIIPEVEDCIAILLSKPEQKHQRQKGVYYLSKGWIDSPQDLLWSSFLNYDRVNLTHNDALRECFTGCFERDFFADADHAALSITELRPELKILVLLSADVAQKDSHAHVGQLAMDFL